MIEYNKQEHNKSIGRPSVLMLYPRKVKRMKPSAYRHNHRPARLLLTAITALAVLVSPSLTASAENTGSREEELLYYTALGDSIPNGYCADDTPELISYPSLIAQDLQTVNHTNTELSQFTKNGLTTEKLNTLYLALPEKQEALSKADIITLTVGANDLMNEFKKVSREILDTQTSFHTAGEALQALQDGISGNPLLLVDVASAITGWDYDSFEEQWVLAVETIHHFRKNDSQMAVTAIYNPVENAELPGTLNAVVKNLIAKMNAIIYEHAEEYDYQVVDLLNSDIAEHTQSDGLHPDQQGQELIRNLIESALDMQIVQITDTSDGEQSEDAKLVEERIAAEKKAADLKAQKAARERLIRRSILAGGVILLILLAAALISRIKHKKKKEP